MTKEDWIWVAIRIFGIYLIVLAVISLPALLGSSIMVHSWWGLSADASEASDLMDTMASRLLTAQFSALLSALCRVIVFTGCGVYLVRSGKLIFRLVSAGPGKDKGAEVQNQPMESDA